MDLDELGTFMNNDQEGSTGSAEKLGSHEDDENDDSDPEDYHTVKTAPAKVIQYLDWLGEVRPYFGFLHMNSTNLSCHQ